MLPLSSESLRFHLCARTHAHSRTNGARTQPHSHPACPPASDVANLPSHAAVVQDRNLADAMPSPLTARHGSLTFHRPPTQPSPDVPQRVRPVHQAWRMRVPTSPMYCASHMRAQAPRRALLPQSADKNPHSLPYRQRDPPNDKRPEASQTTPDQGCRYFPPLRAPLHKRADGDNKHPLHHTRQRETTGSAVPMHGSKQTPPTHIPAAYPAPQCRQKATSCHDTYRTAPSPLHRVAVDTRESLVPAGKADADIQRQALRASARHALRPPTRKKTAATNLQSAPAHRLAQTYCLPSQGKSLSPETVHAASTPAAQCISEATPRYGGKASLHPYSGKSTHPPPRSGEGPSLLAESPCRKAACHSKTHKPLHTRQEKRASAAMRTPHS